jgi:hypothetical protein
MHNQSIKLPKVSQSLVKAWFDYKFLDKECGLWFYENYIKKNPKASKPPSDAMLLGIYFEYLCTGALPRSGEIPQPKVSYAGKSNEKLSAPYERANQSAEFFKQIIQYYGIDILEVGTVIEHEGMNGIIDILAMWGDKKVIIDLKYTGLFDDKWSETGWELESLPMKDSIMIQAVHYKSLWQKIHGEDIDFYFFVFDSSNPSNAKIIKAVIDDSKFASQDVVVRNTKEGLEKELQYGFVANPDLKRCTECPLNDECQYAVKFPVINNVYY